MFICRATALDVSDAVEKIVSQYGFNFETFAKLLSNVGVAGQFFNEVFSAKKSDIENIVNTYVKNYTI